MGDTYGYFWGKYRPAVLKLMVSATDAPQQYKFSAHEVRAANPKDKGRLTFEMTMHKGRAVNDIKSSLFAKDLLRMLQHSGKGSELSESGMYEFKFDKHFVLHVMKTDAQQVIPEELEAIVAVTNEV